MFKVFYYVILLFLLSTQSFGQEEFKWQTNGDGDTTATSSYDFVGYAEYDSAPTPVRWIPYETSCKPCRALVGRYNDVMQDLFDARAWISYARIGRDPASNPDRARPSGDQTEEEMAVALDRSMIRREIYDEKLPQLKAAVAKLEQTAQYLRQQIAKCELQCTADQPRNQNAIGMPAKPAAVKPPELPFKWSGPYPEVCEACRKLAARLNELPEMARDNESQIEGRNAKKAAVELDIIYHTANGEDGYKGAKGKLRASRRELKDVEKDLERLFKNRKKIIENFDKTLEMYNECLKKCPPQKNACVIPSNDGHNSILIGPNDQFGSSAQRAKELRDKATGAVKGAATKAIGNMLGFGGFGGGGSSGPKTDKDRSRGDFTRISSGDTDLDIRASWRDDQLIVSTEIDDTPGNGTFHAQWIEDKDGNVYLPTRYLIFKMYRDWKLTVSWTEDHYVDGEHVFHDEGQEISTGRDLLGTWSLFEGENVATNSVWGMLGFDTAAKGVRHLGAVYDLPPSAFPDDCQLQLVNHISLPDNDPVSTIPLLGSLFKHVDESRKKPETIILIQPAIINDVE